MLDSQLLVVETNRAVWIIAFALLITLCGVLLHIRFKLFGTAGISASIILIDALVSVITLAILTVGSLVLIFVTNFHFPQWYVVCVGLGWLISPAVTLARLFRWFRIKGLDNA